DNVLAADLGGAVRRLMARIEDEAALASDVAHLLAALPPLAQVLRYGSVRKTDTGALAHVVEGLCTRIFIGLPGACASLDDGAAEQMLGRIIAVDGAVR